MSVKTDSTSLSAVEKVTGFRMETLMLTGLRMPILTVIQTAIRSETLTERRSDLLTGSLMQIQMEKPTGSQRPTGSGSAIRSGFPTARCSG